MGDEIDSGRSVSDPRSESKSMVGDKRSAADFGEQSELRPKRVKMRDLESVFRSEGTGTPACANQLTSGKHDMEQEANFAKPKGFGWDLNAEDVSTSPDENPFHPYKNLEYHKSIDASECGSSTGPLEEKDPMRVWKEMKQNGFLSSSHGGIPIPKPRGRKSKFDGPKKKMEIAKREQVDRFAKIAAPSGLLNELNPGIINHVRNSKQVLSIIEALVRSEKLENRKQAIPMKSERNDFENANMVQMNHTGPSYEDGSHRTLGGSSQQKRGFPTLMGGSFYSKDDILALKLSSSTTTASENISSLSNEDSENISSVSSLSVKAANVASQWLELLYQDTKGRLAALQRSKKRVRAVIHTDLPLLISQEFSSNQENEPCAMLAGRCNANAELHRARWSALFDQMDKSLTEEEKQLESWLNQVKDMKRHCEWGLQHFHCHGSQRLGTLENDSRLEEADKLEREVAVRAAAASIYSTCNILTSAENLPRF
ncbi:hypothetical protein C3L33_16535, partial [Rhododendron williamsianum]